MIVFRKKMTLSHTANQGGTAETLLVPVLSIDFISLHT